MNNYPNTGTYIRYETATREDVLTFCKQENLLGSEGYAEKIEQQISYKDSVSRNYTKTRMTASGKKTYTNIYAHKLFMTVPQPCDMKGQTYPALVKKWLEELCADEETARKLVYVFKVVHKRSFSSLEMLVFSRLPEERKKFITYDSDYYWNPSTKRRAKKGEEGVVLLHKKGDYKLDKNGERLEVELHVSEHDTGLFFFKDFQAFMQRLKTALKRAVTKIGFKRHISRYFHYITAKRGFSKASIGKVKLRNRLIRRVNERMYLYEGIFMEFGEDFPELQKQFHSYRQSCNQHLYAMSGVFEGLSYNLSYFQRNESFKDNLQLLERAIDERTAKFDQWIFENITQKFIGNGRFERIPL